MSRFLHDLHALRGFDDTGERFEGEPGVHPLAAPNLPRAPTREQRRRKLERVEVVAGGTTFLYLLEPGGVRHWNQWREHEEQRRRTEAPEATPRLVATLRASLGGGPDQLILAMRRVGIKQVHCMRFLRWLQVEHPPRLNRWTKPLAEIRRLREELFMENRRFTRVRANRMIPREDEILLRGVGLAQAIDRIERRDGSEASLVTLAQTWTRTTGDRYRLLHKPLRWSSSAWSSIVRARMGWAEEDEPSDEPPEPPAFSEAHVWWSSHRGATFGPGGGEARMEAAPVSGLRASLPTALTEALNDALDALRPRQRRVLRWRLGGEGRALTLTEIGEREGVSRERIRQIERSALEDVLDSLKKRLPGLAEEEERASHRSAGRARLP